jgi:hypothetical protein
MKKYFQARAFFFLLMLSGSASFAQGFIRGKVTDPGGEPLIGASVILKSNRSIGANTDLNGFYSLSLPDSSAQIILVSYIGYKTREELVRVKRGQVLIRDYSLSSSADSLKVVVITAKATKARNSYMEKMKMNSSVTLDYVSAETMKKTGDANVVAAVSRVSGVSTNGGIISVRGIGDRYIKTAINGSRIPTLDPFTNNIKLDMFPASLVDNIIIMKTASPDLPGDWAGAYLSVETKDYPDKFTVSVESSFGYNNQSTFQEVLSTQVDNNSTVKSTANNWLGYTNGFQDYNHSSFVNMIIEPSKYQEFIALGLGDYFRSIGVTGTTPWTDTYYKLALVQLGLLSKAQINDNNAFLSAQKAFNNGPYQKQVFHALNDAAVKASKAFPNNWNTSKQKAPFDFSQNFSIGNQVNLFGQPLGILAGFRYSSFIENDPNSFVNTLIDSKTDAKGKPIDYDATTQQITKETKGWSALVNLAYKFSPNHSLSLLFMPNVRGVNSVREGFQSDALSTYAAYQTSIVKNQYFESRQQMVYQIKSEHFFPAPKIKAEINASYTNGSSHVPDFKVINIPIDTSHRNGLDYGAQRYYRYLSDDLFDSRLAAELPLGAKPGLSRKLKFGGAYMWNSRKNDLYNYTVKDGPYAPQFFSDKPGSDPFSPDKFDIGQVTDANGNHSYSVQKYYQNYSLPTDHTIGLSTLKAGYLMLDYAIVPALRFSGGLRVEQAYIHTDVKTFDSLNLPRGDLRRFVQDYGIVNAGNLNETSLLPSAGLIYKVRNEELNPINVRLNFSQTVARPSMRELSGVAAYDYELRDMVNGNPDLKMVQINNYDLRFESYFRSGDNVSISAFYKDFKNHIELVQFDPYGFFWVNNSNQSWLKGIELEGRKVLFSHIELRANASLVDSRTTFVKQFTLTNGTKEFGETVTHTMYGQAPWVLNGILAYTLDSIGFSAALSYNIQGPKLVIEGGAGLPAVYERPRNLLDLTVSKTLGRHFVLTAKVRNVLNAANIRSYKFDEGYLLDYDRYRYGTNYVFSLTYRI